MGMSCGEKERRTGWTRVPVTGTQATPGPRVVDDPVGVSCC